MNYNSAFQEEISSMDKFRYSLIDKRNSHWNEESSEYDKDGYDRTEDEKKIDELAVEIEKYIKAYFEQLPFDFIMEQLSGLGQCPNLLNDDNGHWAVTCDGYQNVVSGDEPEDVETTFYVDAKYWKNSPKEALLNYLNE
jgi:hypothetical protein